jgi:hypothetical protein
MFQNLSCLFSFIFLNYIFEVVYIEINLLGLLFADLTEEELDVRNLMEVRGLAVYGDYLYWVDTQSGKLNRVNKMTGQGEQLVQGGIKEPTDVLVVDKHSFDGKFICYRFLKVRCQCR